MGRYSPTVLPQAVPGFTESLANALSQGTAGYEHFQNIRQAREDRNREFMDREDQLALHGIMPAGWTPPTDGQESPAAAPVPPTAVDGSAQKAPTQAGSNFAGEQRPDVGSFRDLEGALQQQPDAQAQEVTPPAPAPRSASGHPGGWDPVARAFEQVPLPAPVTLPSGRVYDAAGQIRNAAATHLLEQQGALDLDNRKRAAQVSERRAALHQLQGTPGFEKLSDALVEAGAQDPAAFNEIVKNDPKPWHAGSFAEQLALSNSEAEGRAAADARHREPGVHAEQQERAADQFAYRMVAAVAARNPNMDPQLLPRYAQDAGAQEQAEAARLGVTRAHYYAAAQRYADRLTAKTKASPDDDNAFMQMVTGQSKDPATTHARNLPSERSAPAGVAPSSSRGDIHLTAPAAPDSLLNELDQDYNGDLEAIRSELKKRGYDPDATP